MTPPRRAKLVLLVLAVALVVLGVWALGAGVVARDDEARSL